ncbi:MAG: gliding motility-associated C-terminal protein [Sediminibacterium sp.]|nr:gliding motility-associated C-terminal protein [Sediminibacterium sp.]
MKIVFLSVLLCFLFTCKAQNACNKAPFTLSNHLRNPSLEQVLSTCETVIANDSLIPPLSAFIPYWQFPIKIYGAFPYFAQCNQFYYPRDPADEIRNPNSRINRYPLVPQPIPDGRGVTGMMCFRSRIGTPRADTFALKDYISNNLFRVLKKDSLYRISFYLGFGIKDTIGTGFYISGSPMKISIFGLADSSKIPFTSPFARTKHIGCLTQQFKDLVCLGTRTLQGTAEWIKDSITFIAPMDIQSIAIGPACDLSDVPYTERFDSWNAPPGDFYFLDHLQFYQSSVPGIVIEKTAGSLCDGPNASVTLHLKSEGYYSGSKLQWYKNNTAIPETRASLLVTKTQYGEGWYQCGVQNDSICMRSDSFLVRWDPLPSSIIGKNEDTTACNGDTVILKVNGGAFASYVWSDGYTFDVSKQVTQTGIYSVTISNSCTTLTAKKIVNFKECPPALYVPSAFTPNHDQLNDVFRAHFTGKIKAFKMSVYNRAGQRIFYSEDILKGWDGTVKHLPENTGVFVWVVEYTDGFDKKITEKGTVTLIR